MKIHILVCSLFFLIAVPVSAQDAIDLSAATIERSAGDVAQWPITTTITRLDVGAADCAVEFDKKAGPEKWPSVPIPGWNGGTIQYTLWLVRVVNGQVYTGGGIEFWDGRSGGCGPAAGYIQNWYYDGSWGPLHDAGDLTPGERVGFFVTAGDARAKDVRTITARSSVVAVPWPGGSGGSFTFGSVAPPPVVTPPPVIIVPPQPPMPPPAPPAPPAPVPLPTLDLSGVYAQLAALSAKMDVVDQNVTAGRAENRTFFEHVKSIWTQIGEPLMKYVAPAVAAYFLGKKL